MASDALLIAHVMLVRYSRLPIIRYYKPTASLEVGPFRHFIDNVLLFYSLVALYSYVYIRQRDAVSYQLLSSEL
jgi:hypothetical protein